MGRAELTRPIPRNEWWLTFLVVGIFLAVMLTLPFLHLHATHDAVVHGMRHPAVVAALWILWMWPIYRRWQKKERKS